LTRLELPIVVEAVVEVDSSCINCGDGKLKLEDREALGPQKLSFSAFLRTSARHQEYYPQHGGPNDTHTIIMLLEIGIEGVPTTKANATEPLHTSIRAKANRPITP
jgi:hypothetical protein